MLSCHLLTQIARIIRPVSARDLPCWVGRYVTLTSWWVTGKTVQNKKGFVTFEDTTTIYNATFFPTAD